MARVRGSLLVLFRNLVISEMNTAKTLHPDTEAALDHIWTLQSESGAWDSWLKYQMLVFEERSPLCVAGFDGEATTPLELSGNYHGSDYMSPYIAFR